MWMVVVTPRNVSGCFSYQTLMSEVARWDAGWGSYYDRRGLIL